MTAPLSLGRSQPHALCRDPHLVAAITGHADAALMARVVRLTKAGFSDVALLMRPSQGRWRDGLLRCRDRGLLALSTSTSSSEYDRFRVTPAGWASAGVPVPPWVRGGRA